MQSRKARGEIGRTRPRHAEVDERDRRIAIQSADQSDLRRTKRAVTIVPDGEGARVRRY